MTETSTAGATAGQIPLPIRLRDTSSFLNFLPGTNVEALAAVSATAAGTGERVVYLWGGSGSGKTHLLEASCVAASHEGLRCAFLPLKALGDSGADALAGWDDMALLCIDDVDVLAGRPDQEEALLHLYNRAEQYATRLIMSGPRRPHAIGLRLPDLASRLATSLVIRLRALDDPGKRTVLQQRARLRGFGLPDAVAAYLLRHCRRDMHSLMGVLERLDALSLEKKRRVTLPFLKDLLARG